MYSKKPLIFLFFFSALFFFHNTSSHANQNAGKLYYSALKHFEKQSWSKAKVDFTKALQLLKARKIKKARMRHFGQLGICDIMYHLAVIEEKQNKPFEACKLYSRVQKRLNSLPKDWKSWKINPLLPPRFDKAKVSLEACQKKPSEIVIKGLPSGAIIQQAFYEKGKKEPTWKTIKQPIKTTKEQVLIRIQAPGYKTKIRKLQVKRWKHSSEKVALLRKPKPKRVTPTKRPTVKPPKKSSKWPLIIAISAGVVAAGVVSYFLISQQNADEVQPKINSFEAGKSVELNP